MSTTSAVEIPFVFATTGRAEVHPLIGDTPSQAVVDAVHGAWVSFVTDGTPGRAPYTREGRTTALLTDKITEVDDPAGDERALWDGIRQGHARAAVRATVLTPPARR